ncbi:MAG: hypothetical protein JOZ54_11725 [Acidobacteria bacterium]|nr:hypothetical protein [Acidobacteriota bacterium]
MGIDLHWRSSDGTLLDAVYDEASLLSEVIQEADDGLLATIDPYRTTRFLAAQAGTLIEELERIREKAGNVERRIAIGRLLLVLRAAEGGVGDWLEFVGD